MSLSLSPWPAQCALRVPKVAFGRYAIAAHVTGQWDLAASWTHRDICMKVRARRTRDRCYHAAIMRTGGLGSVHRKAQGAAHGVLRRGGKVRLSLVTSAMSGNATPDPLASVPQAGLVREATRGSHRLLLGEGLQAPAGPPAPRGQSSLIAYRGGRHVRAARMMPGPGRIRSRPSRRGRKRNRGRQSDQRGEPLHRAWFPSARSRVRSFPVAQAASTAQAPKRKADTWGDQAPFLRALVVRPYASALPPRGTNGPSGIRKLVGSPRRGASATGATARLGTTKAVSARGNRVA